MGAPGQAFLCSGGHLFDWISDDLDWTDDLIAASESIRKKGCPCGRPTLTVINHYGDINDCLDPGQALDQIGVERVMFRIEGATDAQGQPIEAFVWHELPVYNVSKLQVDPAVIEQDAEFRLLNEQPSK